MNWFGRLLNRMTGADAPAGRIVMAGGRTPAGVYIDSDTALKDATVWACRQYLSRTVAQLPFHAMRSLPGGGSEVASSSPVDWLLSKRPNPEMGSFTFRETLTSWAIMRGNGYAEIQRDNRGAAYALWPIHPDRVTPRRDEAGELYFEVWNPGGSTELAARDMFHIRGYGDGAVGVNVMSFAAESIGWARATQLFGSTFFGEGMNPSMIIETPAGLSPSGLEIMKEEMARLYKGPKGQRAMFLDAGAKAIKLSTNPDDAQFIETRQHQVEEICRWFGVPPHKVMHLLRATFSNIEHQSIEVVVDSITPWCKIWEDEADYKLFGGNRAGLYTKMNLRGLMRGDNASRAAYYKTMFEMGTPANVILGLEDMPGIGPDGDVSFVSNNVQTIANAVAARPPEARAGAADSRRPPSPEGEPAPTDANAVRIAH